jgi:prepilin-type processing-associated H-X9-DG protein
VNLKSIPTATYVLDAWTNPAVIQAALQACNNAWNAQNAQLDWERARFWSHGSQGQTIFNTIVPPNSKQYPWNTCSDEAIGGSAFNNANSYHPGGVNALLADGSVRFVKDSIDQKTWWSLGTKADGEVISSDSH